MYSLLKISVHKMQTQLKWFEFCHNDTETDSVNDYGIAVRAYDEKVNCVCMFGHSKNV